MGLIKDISEKIVPRTQGLMEQQGMNLKKALIIAFKEYGYIGEGEECENSKKTSTRKKHD